MDPWEKKLKESGITEAIDALEVRLSKYDGAELTIEDRGNLDRIRAINDQLRIITEHSDPKTVNHSAVTTIAGHLNNTASYLDSWNGGESPTYLSSHAISQIDAVLIQIPLMSPAINLPEARAAIASIRRSAARQNTIVNELTEKIRAKGSLADETIDEKIATFTKEIASRATTTNESLEAIDIKADSIAEQLSEVKTAASKLATEQNETFNTAQTERTKRFEAMIQDHQDEASGIFTSISEKVTNEVKTVKASAEKSAKLADEARVKSEELLGIVSENALISDYSKNGLHEQKWSRIWQIATVVFLGTAVAVGGFLALHTDDKTSWQKLVARFAVIIATSGLAAYSATQASEHKRAQRHSEHLSLQLSAVRPYLAGIEQKSDRDRLLVKLAEKFFSEWQPKEQKNTKTKKKDSDENTISGDDLPGLIGAIISIVNTANKK